MNVELRLEKLSIIFIEDSETGTVSGTNVGVDGPLIIADSKEEALEAMGRGVMLWSALNKLEVVKKALKADKDDRDAILDSSVSYSDLEESDAIFLEA